MAEQYTRATERFSGYGVDLSSPVDACKPGYYPVLENIRSYADGVLQPRYGLTTTGNLGTVVVGKTPVHSVRRLNDPNSGSAIRVAGTADALAWWETGVGFTRAQYNASNVVFSGNPLALIPYRPDQSISSWMYIGDSTAMYKIIGYNSQSIARGTVHKIGLPPPTTAPTVELGSLAATEIQSLSGTGSAPNNWVVDGVVLTGAPTLTSRVPAGQTTTRALYDSGSSGWVSVVVPNAVASVLGEGEIVGITIGGPAGAFLFVHEVLKQSATSGITITSILYDNAPTNTGTCIIQPSHSIKEIVRNCVVQLDSAGVNVYARVTEVIEGPDQTISFRCSTGASTVAATKTIKVVSSFRSYDFGGLTAAGGDTIYDYAGGFAAGQAAITTQGAGTANSKTGWFQITPSGGLDLTKTNTSGYAVNVSLSDDDMFHIGLLLSDASKITQGRILLDCDSTSLNISSTAAAAGLIRVTTTTSHLLATGDTVFINNHNASTNGTWIITVQSATTFDLNNSAFVANAGAVGTVQPQFKKNFYYRAFKPDDLITAVKATQTAIDNRSTILTNTQIDRPITKSLPHFIPQRKFRTDDPNAPGNGDYGYEQTTPPSNINPNNPDGSNSANRIANGDFQWSDLVFRRGEFVRVGSDNSRGFANINAIRIELTAIDSSTTLVVAVNSIDMYGGFPLDTVDLAIPYIYRYRYRASTTGARSNWSPAMRNGVKPKRGQVSVTCTAATGLPEVDRIDIQRIGGALTTWLNVGTINSGTTYTDKISDEAAIGAAPFSEPDSNYQPWPVLGKPISATTPANVTVVGPYVKDTTALFNTSWAKGTAIKVNGVDTQIRRVVSTTVLECDDSMGSQTNITWEIPEPLIMGQPLPCLWGPWNGYFFACGDPLNPGTLYNSNASDPDSTTDSSYLEVTSPSEPLMNGCLFNGRCYVWSSDRMFEIEQFGLGQFLAVEVVGGKGLFKRWALAVGDRMWFLAKDGIYQSGGGENLCITDMHLKPFFKTDGITASGAINGFYPPDFQSGYEKYTRLAYYDGRLYFSYRDANPNGFGPFRSLTYTPTQDKTGWWPDAYLGSAAGSGNGITHFYGEEGAGVHSLLCGGADGKLYQAAGTEDDATAIACHLRTQYFDGGDRRADKRWGDVILDADPNNATLNLTLYTNNLTSNSLTISPATMTGNGRTQQITDIESGGDPSTDYYRNIALDVAWSSTTATPQLFLWEPSYIVRPETTEKRASDWDDDGYAGDKFFQGIEIEADTQNVARAVRVEYDGGTLAETLTIQHNGRQQKVYPFHPAFIAHMVRLHPNDTSNWNLYKYRWIRQIEPPLADRWESQQTSFGADTFLHMKSLYVTLMSTAAVTLTITRTDDGQTFTYTIASTAGVRKKVYVPIAPIKGKAFIFVFTSTVAFRLYKDDTNVMMKVWDSEDSYHSINPFGTQHGDGAAPV